MSASTNEIFRLLQPGLMTEDEIRRELISRGVKMKEIRSLTKSEMVEMYLHYFMPLPQREFPSTGHGKVVSQMIARENIALKKSSRNVDASSALQYGFGDSTSQVSVSSVLGKRGGDRLKPPLNQSQVSSKKISLLSRTSSTDHSLDRVVIKDRSKERRSSREEEQASGERKQNVHESAVLKRSSTSSSDNKSEEGSPSKKVKKRIQWP